MEVNIRKKIQVLQDQHSCILAQKAKEAAVNLQSHKEELEQLCDQHVLDVKSKMDKQRALTDQSISESPQWAL